MSAADDIRALLGEAVAAPPPADLIGRVTTAANSRRPAGTPIDSLGGGRRADPIAAYLRTVDELSSTLEATDRRITVLPYGWTVAQLLAHLVGIERYFGHRLGLWPLEVDASTEDDHLAMTNAAVQHATATDHDALFAEWRRLTRAVCDHLRGLAPARLSEPIKFHYLDTRLSTILVVRVFELWTHTEDLCRAADAPAVAVDAERLRLMTDTAVSAIPFGLLLSGAAATDATARLVLTGPGGGVWHQPLQFGASAGEPAVTIVATALDFCRLAAQRIEPAALVTDVEGDAALIEQVLRGASVFAA